MNFNVKTDNDRMVIELDGRLDTMTSPQLDEFLHTYLDGVKQLVFDLSRLEYISSAGLRVLLYAHKTVSRNGNMIVIGCSEEVTEIFDITGFSDIMDIR